MPWLDRSDEALEASCAQADENSCQGWAGPVGEAGVGTRAGPHNLQHCHAHRSERETAARISQEIGDLMKEIETLVEEKTKESLDVSRLTREGEPAEGACPQSGPPDRSPHIYQAAAPARALLSPSYTSFCLNSKHQDFLHIQHTKELPSRLPENGPLP